MTHGNKRPALFRTLADEVLRLKKPRAQKTRIAARAHLKRLKKYFGDMWVSQITDLTWGRYVVQCKNENPTRKLYDDRKYMSQVMRLAASEGMTTRKLRLKIPDVKSFVGREITADEIERLKANAPAQLKFQIKIAVSMGLRHREMMRLRWDSIDFHKKVINLANHETKTRRGRTIPLNPDLVEEFKLRWSRAKSAYVFPHRFDPVRPQITNKTSWVKCKRLAGVKARWHDLRHTCATLLLRNGVKSYVARRYLGMSEHVLTNIYVHLNDGDLQEAAELMRQAG